MHSAHWSVDQWAPHAQCSLVSRPEFLQIHNLFPLPPSLPPSEKHLLELETFNRPLPHKLLTINKYVNCPSNISSICLFHRPIFEKILIWERSFTSTGYLIRPCMIAVTNCSFAALKQENFRESSHKKIHPGTCINQINTREANSKNTYKYWKVDFVSQYRWIT